MAQSSILTLAIAGNMLSIAFYNFFGISITDYSSATTRMVLDTMRTVTIWIFSVAVGWQPFEPQTFSWWLQPIGFVVLLSGTAIYNRVEITVGGKKLSAACACLIPKQVIMVNEESPLVEQ